jgi:hypothetical protein
MANLLEIDFNGRQPPAYPMTREPVRGKCVVVNNMNFDFKRGVTKYSRYRAESQLDEDSIIHVWKQLKFECERITNVCLETFDEKMKNLVDDANRQAHRGHPYGAMACYVLTHGDDGDKLIMRDKNSISVDALLDFWNNRRCPGLQNKPKLIFIQACRGSKDDAGVQSTTDDDHIQYDGRTVLLPTSSDMFVSYATPIGCRAYGRKSSGSYFIQSQLQVISKYAATTDITGIMELTRASVIKTLQTEMEVNIHLKEETIMQCPEDKSTLTRRMSLMPQKD